MILLWHPLKFIVKYLTYMYLVLEGALIRSFSNLPQRVPRNKGTGGENEE